jgi:hypothetical protein
MGQQWRSKFKQVPNLLAGIVKPLHGCFPEVTGQAGYSRDPDRSIQELNPPCDPKVGAGRHRG